MSSVPAFEFSPAPAPLSTCGAQGHRYPLGWAAASPPQLGEPLPGAPAAHRRSWQSCCREHLLLTAAAGRAAARSTCCSPPQLAKLLPGAPAAHRRSWESRCKEHLPLATLASTAAAGSTCPLPPQLGELLLGAPAPCHLSSWHSRSHQHLLPASTLVCAALL